MPQQPTCGRNAPPTSYLIEVDVDACGNFAYMANGVDARHIRPHLGDTISWKATLMNCPTAFQIEFMSIGPFGGRRRVQRSLSGPTTPATVELPPNYKGNLIFEYTVSVANGWSDDPDIEPVPFDGVEMGLHAQLVLLSLDGNGNLVITPDPASFSPGVITWRWETEAVQDDFTITFASPPPGWPQRAQSQSHQIALNLPATSGAISYTVDTATLGVSRDGEITVQ